MIAKSRACATIAKGRAECQMITRIAEEQLWITRPLNGGGVKPLLVRIRRLGSADTAGNAQPR